MKSYEEMLEDVLKRTGGKKELNERFEIPKSRIINVGNKTIINNFSEMAQTMRRDESHFSKFLLKELATSGYIKEKRLFLTGRFRKDQIDKKIEIYYKCFVECPECKKPDTRLIKEERVLFIKCEACGARHVVKRR